LSDPVPGPAPTVSVILPVFNRERYLADSIESVLSQTFADWELVVVDDGSSDGSPAIIERYRLSFPGKVKPVFQANAGVAAARNRGITASTGELIAFIDSDDLWHPRKLERQVEAFRAAAGVAFVYTGYEIIDSAGRSLGTVQPDPRFQGDIYEKLWTVHNRILGPTIMATREMLYRVGLFDERLRAGENLDLRIKLARVGPVAFVTDSLYRYRRHPESLSADWRGTLEQTRRLIDHHLAEPKTAREVELRRTALSRYYQERADGHFGRAEYGQALAWYRKAWVGSRKKGQVLVRSLRCLLGRPGNALLRRLRRRAAAAGGSGGEAH
jgi:glycosyltransferase involved in cell wall biosynthesis